MIYGISKSMPALKKNTHTWQEPLFTSIITLRHLLVYSRIHWSARYRTNLKLDLTIILISQPRGELICWLFSLVVSNWLKRQESVEKVGKVGDAYILPCMWSPLHTAWGSEPCVGPLTSYNECGLLSTLLVLKGGLGSKLAEKAVFWQLIPSEWVEYWWGSL